MQVDLAVLRRHSYAHQITGTGKAVGPIVMFSVPSISFGTVPAGSHAKSDAGLDPTATGLRIAQLVFMNQNPGSGPEAILPLSASGI
jgi:hypothetical protein